MTKNVHICSMCIKINKVGKTGSMGGICGSKNASHDMGYRPNIRFLPSIVAEKNTTKNGHIQNVCSMCIKINKVGKQEVGI